MPHRWDPDTETFDFDVGNCPYCGETIYENPDPDIKYVGYSNVRKLKNHNEIVKICFPCMRDLKARKEVTDRKIGEWTYVYEFVYK